MWPFPARPGFAQGQTAMTSQLKKDFASQGLMTDGSCQYGNVKIASKILGVSESCLNKWRMSGDGPPFLKWGASVIRYHIPTLRAWAELQTRRSTSDDGEAA
jgi:hypothetical protein